MHTRVPSFTFTNEQLFGLSNWEIPPAQQTVFYQGSTITLDFMLAINDKPLGLFDNHLLFLLKKSGDATNVLFRQAITEKVADKPDGYYRVTIPDEVTFNLRPGVYYFAVQATQKATGGIYPPFTGTFSLELSAASPNPNLGVTDGEPTADGVLNSPGEKLSPAEITGPNTPDIGRQF